MNFTIILAILLAISVAGNALLGKLLISSHEATARVQQAYDSFTAQVKVLGEEAQKKADAQKLADKQRKEKSDVEHTKAVAALTSTIGKLRSERDEGRNRDFLPAPATGATGADISCFDRPAYLSAYGGLVKGLRGLADEGTSATMSLDDAKRWAQAP